MVTVAATTEITLFVSETAAPDSPNSFLAPPGLHLLANLLDDVVLALEESKAAASVRQVVDVPWNRLRETVHLVDELRDERRADRRRRRSARGRTRC